MDTGAGNARPASVRHAARSAASDTPAAPEAPADWLDAIRADLQAGGFAQVGAAPLVPETPDAADRLREWLARGYAGSMRYLVRPDAVAARLDPSARWPWARSIVAAAYPYLAEPPETPAPAFAPAGRIARYAAAADYHDLLGKKLRAHCRAWQVRWPGVRCRYYVDTGPILERQWAARAGIGWLGKNTLLIHPEAGSYHLLGVMLTNLEIAEPSPPIADRCGSCTACLDACPTGAFPAPGLLDARRCLSYLTIEQRGAHESEAAALAAEHNRGWLFGCDVCQEVCPYNRRAPVTPAAERLGAGNPLGASGAGAAPGRALAELLALDDAAFRARFRHTPVWRAKRAGLRRNALNVLAGLPAGSPAFGDHALWELVRRSLTDDDPGVRQAAAAAEARRAQR